MITYHSKHIRKIGINSKSEAYIQAIVLKVTFKSIFLERRQGIEEESVDIEVELLTSRKTEALAQPTTAEPQT